MDNKTIPSILILVVSIVILGLIVMVGSKQVKPADPVELAKTGWSKGPENARVTIIEFADFQCPACAVSAPIVAKIIDDYPNDIRFIYKHFPLSYHANAIPSATTAEVAGEDGKFFEMAALLYAKQSEWESLSDSTQYLSDLGKSIGVDGEKIKQAIASNKYRDKINDDKREGDSIGIDATPTFFVNGEKISGGMAEEDWKKLIDQNLSKR